jgi:hypothetical protein
MSLRMRYDQEDDVLMVWFADNKKVDHAERTGSSILHLTEQDEPVMLEILNARDFVVDLVRTAIAASTETPGMEVNSQ